MTDETQNPAKKLIIDEDWKSQVEAEKEAAHHTDESPQPAAESSSARVPLPPADLMFLIGTLYLQGAMSLGLLPNPVTNKAEVQIEQAKHSIGLLAMLQQKTENNRTQEESDELEAALHQLRLTFVAIGQK